MITATFPLYAAVVPDVAISKSLDYGVPERLVGDIMRGSRVQIPIRGMLRSGYVFELKSEPAFHPVRPIAAVLTTQTPLTPDLFELAIWMARYYCAPLGHVLKVLLPAGVRGKSREKHQLFVMRAKTIDELTAVCAELRRTAPAQAEVLDVMLKVRKGVFFTELLELTEVTAAPVKALHEKGFLLIEPVRVDRSPLINEEYFTTRAKVLMSEQAAALKKIESAILAKRYEGHLLHGVTGSGKTEVYLQAIDCVLKQGRGSLMLVPEIALTPQTIERFRSRFDAPLAVLHHRLSHGERFDEWHRIRRGEAKIVIGARSAVFSPVPDLGLIVVDEEHEHSYKQSESEPCYHARDVAVMRGTLNHCPVILGSATPSAESYHNALTGKYQLSTLRLRADAAAMPTVRIISMQKEFEKAGGFVHFCEPLLAAIKQRHAIGEQTILFLNRRGYHTSLLCSHCSQAVRCPHCDVALTFHKGESSLLCHLCGYVLVPPPRQCPSCRQAAPMKFRGVGTEQIEKALHQILPEIRTLRIDADTTRHKGSHQRLLREFGTGKADVLVGTQMIAKGLHFPQVTLVGILNSDSALNIPDFRSGETTFQLLTQVSGRAGRGHSTGEVIIQTFMPDQSTIQLASKADYETFIKEELKTRELLQYPPYSQFAKLLFTGLDAEKVTAVAERYREALRQRLPKGFELHPILPAGHPKIKDHFRFQFLIQGSKGLMLSQQIEEVQRLVKVASGVRVLVDINPTSTFF
jgi:primosomal protein N' (replication factor Y)